eukprot:jgi/Mesvir1/1416/Mv14415-RA.1
MAAKDCRSVWESQQYVSAMEYARSNFHVVRRQLTRAVRYWSGKCLKEMQDPVGACSQAAAVPGEGLSGTPGDALVLDAAALCQMICNRAVASLPHVAAALVTAGEGSFGPRMLAHMALSAQLGSSTDEEDRGTVIGKPKKRKRKVAESQASTPAAKEVVASPGPQTRRRRAAQQAAETSNTGGKDGDPDSRGVEVGTGGKAEAAGTGGDEEVPERMAAEGETGGKAEALQKGKRGARQRAEAAMKVLVVVDPQASAAAEGTVGKPPGPESSEKAAGVKAGDCADLPLDLALDDDDAGTGPQSSEKAAGVKAGDCADLPVDLAGDDDDAGTASPVEIDRTTDPAFPAECPGPDEDCRHCTESAELLRKHGEHRVKAGREHTGKWGDNSCAPDAAIEFANAGAAVVSGGGVGLAQLLTGRARGRAHDPQRCELGTCIIRWFIAIDTEPRKNYERWQKRVHKGCADALQKPVGKFLGAGRCLTTVMWHLQGCDLREVGHTCRPTEELLVKLPIDCHMKCTPSRRHGGHSIAEAIQMALTQGCGTNGNTLCTPGCAGFHEPPVRVFKTVPSMIPVMDFFMETLPAKTAHQLPEEIVVRITVGGEERKRYEVTAWLCAVLVYKAEKHWQLLRRAGRAAAWREVDSFVHPRNTVPLEGAIGDRAKDTLACMYIVAEAHPV